jgi:hypothetical protein
VESPSRVVISVAVTNALPFRTATCGKVTVETSGSVPEIVSTVPHPETAGRRRRTGSQYARGAGRNIGMPPRSRLEALDGQWASE